MTGEKPRFKRCFQVEIVEPEGVFLISERGSFLLSDRYSRLVAPLIDGSHTAEDIIQLLAGKISAPEVYYTLGLLEQKGYIAGSDDSLPAEAAAFWDSLDARDTAKRLQATRVAVRACGNVPTEPFISTLQSLNIQVGEEGDIAAVLTDDYLQESLEAFNQKALQSQRPWMLVKPAGSIIWIGPVFHPGKTGCWECLAQRLRINRPLQTFVGQRKGTATPWPASLSALPSTRQTALGIAATEIAKWIVEGESKQLQGNLVTLDTLSLEWQNHKLVRRPQCPACGSPEFNSSRKPAPVVLASRKKIFTADGGHRCVAPEETLKKYEHHISPITGAVRSLKRSEPADSPWAHNYVAGHNFATLFDDLYFLRQNIRGISGGKGKTDLQARASGLCEALERYSGVFQGEESRQKGTYRQMGEAAIHPNACMNFSEAQYRSRQEWNARCAPSQRVPEPFDEDAEIEWTPVWSLTHQDWKFLPTAYCYYGYPRSQNPYCWADSNGAAAGNTLEEAILQGFMELAERDSVCLWWYNRISRPPVNLESFDEPYFQALKDYYQTLQREFWVLDITSDLNVPAFVAISRRADREREDFIFGFGAHFDPKLGIQRALTEMNQSLPAVLAGAATEGALKSATLGEPPYLFPDRSTAPKALGDYPHLGSDDLRDDVMTCVALARENGMEMLVLDQTRPDIGLNAVKVIVPGLRHFWKRLAPGRLYDAPVKLGWLKEPLTENQLNPSDLF
jgi:ribosomal protein S12 methylthiotransferase accessory factor